MKIYKIARAESIVEEIDGYSESQELMTVNRDGDKFYIECPECHSTDLDKQRIFGCKDCHTRFTVYLEDGFDSIDVDTDFGSLGSYEGIKVVALKGDDSGFGDYKVLHGRNQRDGVLEEIRKKYPKIISDT